MCTVTKDLAPRSIHSAGWHSAFLDKDGDVYRAGYIKNFGVEHGEFTKQSLSAKARLVACGKFNVIVVSEENKIFVQGRSKDGHLGPNTSYESFTKFKMDEDEEFEKLPENKIISVTSGTHFSLFVTEGGKLYGCGNRFMKEIGLDTEDKIIHVPLAQGLKVVGAWASMSK